MSLRDLRLKRGLTQQQLAGKVPGANAQRISGYENGRYKLENATFGTVLAICDALHVSNPRRLLDSDTKPPTE